MLIRVGAALNAVLLVLLVLAQTAGRVGAGGEQLIFEGEHRGMRDLLLADVARGLVAPLTRSPQIVDEHPVWSPDGAQIAFVRMSVQAARRVCVWALPPSHPLCLPAVFGWIDAPVWSPDGIWLVVESVDERYGVELYRMPAQGGAAQRLTLVEGNDSDARWSPDGSRIVWTSTRDGLRQLYTQSMPEGAPLRISDGRANDMQPRWSPDGRWLAFVSDRGLREDIYLLPTDCIGMDVGCPVLRRLTKHNALLTDLVWSPDSAQIGFISNLDGDFEVYTVALASGQTARWTDNGAVEEDPTWSPDGAQIAYISNRTGRYHVYVQSAADAAAQRLTFADLDHWLPAWRPSAP